MSSSPPKRPEATGVITPTTGDPIVARKLDAYTPSTEGRGRPPSYPWDQWLDGNIWELTRGRPKARGYSCSVHTDEAEMKVIIVPQEASE